MQSDRQSYLEATAKVRKQNELLRAEIAERERRIKESDKLQKDLEEQIKKSKALNQTLKNLMNEVTNLQVDVRIKAECQGFLAANTEEEANKAVRNLLKIFAENKSVFFSSTVAAHNENVSLPQLETNLKLLEINNLRK